MRPGMAPRRADRVLGLHFFPFSRPPLRGSVSHLTVRNVISTAQDADHPLA
ncbi:hypothetical protein ACFVXC_18655 [Streptomyces sp. NPDC058257]|uniref:hypothetical protein n=1 Tax=Streptomyces sp. NPDC058257 TaxID=3346409 RepID=UPI0036E0BFB2